MKYLPFVRPKLVQKIKNAQNLQKFDIFNILSMPISTLMLKIIFMKHLPALRPN